MPSTRILTIGTSAASSDTAVLAAGESVNLARVGPGSEPNCLLVEAELSDDTFVFVGWLADDAVRTVNGPMTYRVRRVAVAVGVGAEVLG